MREGISIPEKFIEIDPGQCTGCGSCVTICGAEVFEIKEKKAAIAHLEACLECGNCEVVCMADAIKFHIPKGGTGIIYRCG